MNEENVQDGYGKGHGGDQHHAPGDEGNNENVRDDGNQNVVRPNNTQERLPPITN